MVLVQNRYKNTLVGVLRTQITFVTHSSPSCYVTLCTQVIRLNSSNLSPQKTDSGVYIIVCHQLKLVQHIQCGRRNIKSVKWPLFHCEACNIPQQSGALCIKSAQGKSERHERQH